VDPPNKKIELPELTRMCESLGDGVRAVSDSTKVHMSVAILSLIEN
jgi:hypothetical protein